MLRKQKEITGIAYGKTLSAANTKISYQQVSPEAALAAAEM